MISQESSSIRIHAIICKSNGSEILLIQNDSGWVLPEVANLEAPGGFIVRVNRAVHKLLGITTSLLHCVSYELNDSDNSIEAVYALESHRTQSASHPDARWINHTDFPSMILARESHRDIVESWFKYTENFTASQERLAPWQHPGWLSESMKWIGERLSEYSIALTGKFRHIASTSVHFLIEVETTSGNFYLKIVKDYLAYEQSVTCALAKWCPSNLPEIIAVDEERHWFLMRGAEGKILRDSPDLRHWIGALQSFARLQILCIERIDTLFKLGCPDYRLENLPGQIDWFFTTLAELEAVYMPPAVERNISLLSGQFKELCERLANFHIPSSIVHSDLNGNNVIVNDNNIVYIDWATSFIGHPFYSLVGAPSYAGHLYPELKESRDQLRQAYLNPWSDYLGVTDLRKAYQLSRPLCLLQSAVDLTYDFMRDKGTDRDRGAEGIAFVQKLLRAAIKAAAPDKIG